MTSTPELWTVPLRTVTPAFIGGAEPNEHAELRVPSIRGALRAWYRLLVGPEVAAGIVPELGHLRESRLFGGTGPGEGQGAVLLSIEGSPPTGEYPWNPRGLPGLAYLGFTLRMGDNARKALTPGTKFSLRLFYPRGIDDERARLLLSTLWLWINLGGLGTRSRRGFGSITWDGEPSFLHIHKQPLEKRDLQIIKDTDLTQLGQYFVNGAGRAYDRVRKSLGTTELQQDHLAYRLHWVDEDKKRRTRIILWGGNDRRGWGSAQEALDVFGSRFSEFRKTPGIDGLSGSALGMLTRKERLPHAPRRVAFGLPLTLSPRSRGDRFDLLPYSRTTGTGGRAPSPLLVRVCPMGERFIIVLTLLSGDWPGRDVEVRERRQHSGFLSVDPDNDLPHRFLDGLTRRTEVEL